MQSISWSLSLKRQLWKPPPAWDMILITQRPFLYPRSVTEQWRCPFIHKIASVMILRAENHDLGFSHFIRFSLLNSRVILLKQYTHLHLFVVKTLTPLLWIWHGMPYQAITYDNIFGALDSEVYKFGFDVANFVYQINISAINWCYCQNFSCTKAEVGLARSLALFPKKNRLTRDDVILYFACHLQPL